MSLFGSSVLLGNLFKANDWRDKPVIVYNDKDKVYEAAKENNVNLYEYYGISAITLDIDNATCDVNVIGEQKPINKDVIKLTILDKVGGTAISTPIDIKTTNISKLNSVVLNYKNNMGNTKDFRGHLVIFVAELGCLAVAERFFLPSLPHGEGIHKRAALDGHGVFVPAARGHFHRQAQHEPKAVT